jgi:hypothetical protein
MLQIIMIAVWIVLIGYIVYTFFRGINKTKGHIALRTVNELLKHMGIRVEQYNGLD